MLELRLIIMCKEFPCGKNESRVAKEQMEVTQSCSWLSNGCGKNRQDQKHN